jgi:glyoxylase-like metal-dependent hydrolase (beta-lactamase superfamily II)
MRTPTPAKYREPGTYLGGGVHAVGPARRGLAQGGYSRAYLFEETGGFTLVDALWDEDAHVIVEYLWSIGCAPTDVTNICVTHAHRSHLGGLATMRALSGAPVHSHPAEAPIIEGRKPAAKIPLRPLRPPHLIPFRIASQLGLQPHVPCRVDCPDLGVGENLSVGGLEAWHLPGHTPGNLTFIWAGGRVMAVADMILTWPHFSAGWPRFNVDDDEFRRSLEKIVERAPDIVCTGHGDPIVENTARRISALL